MTVSSFVRSFAPFFSLIQVSMMKYFFFTDYARRCFISLITYLCKLCNLFLAQPRTEISDILRGNDVL